VASTHGSLGELIAERVADLPERARTLLEIVAKRREPSTGVVYANPSRIGRIAQGATDWMLDESLLSELSLHDATRSPEALAELLIAHKFPLALAERPMRSLLVVVPYELGQHRPQTLLVQHDDVVQTFAA